MARPGAAVEPSARPCVAVAQVVKVQAGCVAIWRAYGQSAVRPVIIVEPPSSKPLPTPPNVLPIWPKPDSADEMLEQAITHTRTCQFRHPVEYDHAYEGDVLTIVRTGSQRAISHEHEEVRMGRTKHG